MIQPNIIVSISGIPKTGKTHFALTFPPPIKLYSFDLGADFVRTKFPDKEIEIHNFVLPIVDSTDSVWAMPIWEEFYAEYKADIEGGGFQTVVIDTASAVEEVLRQSILEEFKQDKPEKQTLASNEYVARNLRMGTLFSRPRNAGMNLVTIQYLRDEWIKAKNSKRAEPTGNLILDGWNKTEGQADINIEMSTNEKGGKTVMVATIKSNRFDRDLNGQSFDDSDYQELTALLGF